MRRPSIGRAMEEMPCWWVSTSRVITGTKNADVATFEEEMKATFQMSDLGPLSFYLEIQVHQDDSWITLR